MFSSERGDEKIIPGVMYSKAAVTLENTLLKIDSKPASPTTNPGLSTVKDQHHGIFDVFNF